MWAFFAASMSLSWSRSGSVNSIYSNSLLENKVTKEMKYKHYNHKILYTICIFQILTRIFRERTQKDPLDAKATRASRNQHRNPSAASHTHPTKLYLECFNKSRNT